MQRTVLLLHAGIADSSMWRPQVDVLGAAGYRILAPDLRGYGDRRLEPELFSHVRDVEALLDGPAAVVGASLGGRVALQLAAHRPDLVERLVLMGPALPGWDMSEETRAGWAAEEAAYERGDLGAAAEACLRMWVDGGRAPEAVDPGLREAVSEMVLRSYTMQAGAWEAGAEEVEVLDAPVRDLLGAIGCATLVLVGDRDIPDMRAIAAHVAGSIPGARLETVAGAAHLPSLERPDEVNALLLAFLADG